MSLLREAMTAGVFVEFLDGLGNCQGHAVFVDWRGRPVPNLGDTLSAAVATAEAQQTRRLTGTVAARHFELQRDAAGRPEVWVRLEVRTEPSPPASADGKRLGRPPSEIAFSDN